MRLKGGEAGKASFVNNNSSAGKASFVMIIKVSFFDLFIMQSIPHEGSSPVSCNDIFNFVNHWHNFYACSVRP